MIRWKLNQVMALRRISGKDLASKLDIHPNRVSRMRKVDEMPCIDGNLLNILCDALECSPSDLIEYIPSRQTKNKASLPNINKKETWEDWYTQRSAYAGEQSDHESAAFQAALAAEEYAKANWHSSQSATPEPSTQDSTETKDSPAQESLSTMTSIAVQAAFAVAAPVIAHAAQSAIEAFLSSQANSDKAQDTQDTTDEENSRD